MDKVNGWIMIVLAILLGLSLLNVASASIGTATSGVLGWLIALGVLVMGILKVINK